MFKMATIVAILKFLISLLLQNWELYQQEIFALIFEQGVYSIWLPKTLILLAVILKTSLNFFLLLLWSRKLYESLVQNEIQNDPKNNMAAMTEWEAIFIWDYWYTSSIMNERSTLIGWYMYIIKLIKQY